MGQIQGLHLVVRLLRRPSLSFVHAAKCIRRLPEHIAAMDVHGPTMGQSDNLHQKKPKRNHNGDDATYAQLTPSLRCGHLRQAEDTFCRCLVAFMTTCHRANHLVDTSKQQAARLHLPCWVVRATYWIQPTQVSGDLWHRF